MASETLEKIRKKYPARIPRARAIKLYCKEQCACGDMESWKNCTISACFLYQFRMGREVLGNKTSFKKQRRNRGFFTKKEPSTNNISPIPKEEEVKVEEGIKNE